MTAPALEWTHDPGGFDVGPECWYVEEPSIAGLCVMECDDGFEWYAHTESGTAPTLAAAQSAALTAATRLLIEALAAVPVEADCPFTVITDRYASRPGLLLAQDCRPRVHPFFAMEPEEAASLGHALIAAGAAATKPRAGEGG